MRIIAQQLLKLEGARQVKILLVAQNAFSSQVLKVKKNCLLSRQQRK